MSVALLYTGMALLGYIIAVPLRARKEIPTYIAKTLPIVVTMLIFLMGFRVGSNEEVVGNLGTIGLLSLSMAVFSLITAVASMRALRKLLGYDKKANRAGSGSTVTESSNPGPTVAKQSTQTSDVTETPGSGDPEQSLKNRIPWGTVRYVTAMLLGFFLGYFLVTRNGTIDYEASKNVTAVMVTYGLYTLVFLVGVDLGIAGDIVDKFRETGSRIFLFPLVGGITTIISIFLFFPLLPLDPKETLGVACTFGWYSLGPNILLDQGLVVASAYAFLTNFARDMLSLFTIPFVAKRFGYLETITMAQAASMDVCISVISASTNRITTAYAFASGLIFTIIIPIIMPILASF